MDHFVPNVHDPSVCDCGPGFGFSTQLGTCEPCREGSYKDTAGNFLCSNCPDTRSTIGEGAKTVLECLCEPGLVANGTECMDCPRGFYCDGTGGQVSCAEGATTADVKATSADSCICEAGRLKSTTTCDPCPQARYKPAMGNDVICPFQCPTNADSNLGATSLVDCFCSPGFFAALDSMGKLSRCVSCEAMNRTLDCKGGFRNQTKKDHVLPVAKPGFFQTGVITALKCNAKTEDGSSACLGGSACLQDDGDDNCIELAGFRNLCASGTTGLLCGECPMNWAKDSFRTHCRECSGSAGALTASIILDVTTKALISFVVASMAAIAAVRNNGKLHTSMIRIVSQWLAACSVLTVFDLDQLRTLVFSDDATRGFDTLLWPVWVSNAMRELLDSVALVQLQVSVYYGIHCYAQALMPDEPAAKNAALVAYYLALPLLTAAATVLVCLGASHLVAPLATYCGQPLNEAGRRLREKAKVVQQLHNAVLPILEPSGLTWQDVKVSGMLHVSLAALRRGTESPDEFLCQGATASPALLLKVCQLRSGCSGAFSEPEEVFAMLGALAEEIAPTAEDFNSFLNTVASRFETSGLSQSDALEDKAGL